MKKRRKRRKKEKEEEACKKRKKENKDCEDEISLPDPPNSNKEIKQEILDFLRHTEDYPDKSDEEIKELFKADLPLKEYVKAGFNLNIYWIRRGVKGVGCGVTSREEGKDVGFYGYRTQCECWVVAMAAALKSCDIFAPFMHLKLYVITYSKLVLVIIHAHACCELDSKGNPCEAHSFLNYWQPL